MKRCSNPQCTNLLEDGDAFCPVCGTRWQTQKKRKILPAFLVAFSLALLAGIVWIFDSFGIFPVSQVFCQHVWESATCISPKTCSKCGKTEGSTIEHTWKKATCTTAKTCTVCGKEAGQPLGHTWKAATCVTPKTCTRCGETEGAPHGHEWFPEDSSPQRCIRCFATHDNTTGNISKEQKKATEPTVPAGYIDSVDGDWESVTLHDGYSTLNTHAFVFSQKLKQCREMTISMNVSMKAGTNCKDWQLWGRVDGQFQKIAKIDLPAGDGFVSQTVQFDTPITLDAVIVTPTIPGGYSWSMSLLVTDVRAVE